jgi:RNA polymerase sigma-70 factor, ECF subfamily
VEREREIDVVTRVLKGDRNAYALLVEEYKKAIFNLAYRMTGSYDDADDLSQETFLRAYRELRRFDKERRFFTWLYTIGLNLIRNHLKARKAGPVGDMEQAFESSVSASFDGHGAEEALFQSHQAYDLGFCLQKLPADLREAIVLRFYQDLSFEDMTEVLHVSLSAAKMRVYRGLQELKRLLTPAC